jgi:glutamate synthase (NADPH/NADH) small chain
MGNPTGFIKHKRNELSSRPPLERIKDWREIKTSSLPNKKILQKQASRCMDCGIPFCSSGIMLGNLVSGCPLHNLMPEFNDFVYQNLDEFAYARLDKTNNFPEFTAHVCPAPCEGACTASLVTEPVTIKNLEQYVIETAFAKNLVKPKIPENRTGKKVAVIGSGPAGLACADELNKKGHYVTVFERDDRPGGLLMYGIPNMKLEKSLITRRIEIMEKSGIKFSLNSNIGHNISSETLFKQFDAIVLCTGSTVPRDLNIKGRELNGIHFAKDYLSYATKQILDSEESPITAKDKDVVIIGGGDTGNDCIATAIRQGCKSVRQFEINPCLPHYRTINNPWPEFPRVFKTDYGQEEAIAYFEKDPREYCINTKEFLGKDGNVEQLKICQVEWEYKNNRKIPNNIKNTDEIIPTQLVLIAIGFAGTEENIFNEFKFTKSAQNNILANENDFTTSIPGVFAAGDARRGQSLVVWGISEGRRAAEAVNDYLK